MHKMDHETCAPIAREHFPIPPSTTTVVATHAGNLRLNRILMDDFFSGHVRRWGAFCILWRSRNTCGARWSGRSRRTPSSRSTSAGTSTATTRSNRRSTPSTYAPGARSPVRSTPRKRLTPNPFVCGSTAFLIFEPISHANPSHSKNCILTCTRALRANSLRFSALF